MGWRQYEPLVARYRVPIVVTGFEPLDVARGHPAWRCGSSRPGRAEVENAYPRAVSRARATAGRRGSCATCSRSGDRAWRGIGVIPRQWPGCARSGRVRRCGAIRRRASARREPAICIAGEILQGRTTPHRLSRVRRSLHARPTRSGRRWCRRRGPAAAYHRYGRVRAAIP